MEILNTENEQFTVFPGGKITCRKLTEEEKQNIQKQRQQEKLHLMAIRHAYYYQESLRQTDKKKVKCFSLARYKRMLSFFDRWHYF